MQCFPQKIIFGIEFSITKYEFLGGHLYMFHFYYTVKFISILHMGHLSKSCVIYYLCL